MVVMEMTPRRVFAWLFICTLLLGVLFQWWVLPLTPWYAGHGLMAGGDWLRFFDWARDLAERIRSEGWGVWELRYEGQWPASLMAAAFVLTGWEHASVVLPIYAALYGLTGAYLTSVALKLGIPSGRAWVVLIVLAFPSTVLIWGQPHKDAFALAGIALLAWSWSVAQLGADKARWLRVVLGVFAGFGLMWLPRPYLLDVSFAALLIGVAVSIACAHERRVSVLRGLALVLLALMAVMCYKEAGQAGQAAPKLCSTWHPELYIPLVNEQVGALLCYRHGFIADCPGQASNIDFDQPLTNYGELLTYLPRAAFFALASPVPHADPLIGNAHATSPGGKVKRAVAAYEMLVLYGALIGCVIWMWKGRGERRAFVFGLFAFSLAVAMFYVLTTPNEGALYRLRFPEITLWWLLGVAGWNLLRSDRLA